MLHENLIMEHDWLVFSDSMDEIYVMSMLFEKKWGFLSMTFCNNITFRALMECPVDIEFYSYKGADDGKIEARRWKIKGDWKHFELAPGELEIIDGLQSNDEADSLLKNALSVPGLQEKRSKQMRNVTALLQIPSSKVTREKSSLH